MSYWYEVLGLLIVLQTLKMILTPVVIPRSGTNGCRNSHGHAPSPPLLAMIVGNLWYLVSNPSVCQDPPVIMRDDLGEDIPPESSHPVDGDETSVFTNLIRPGSEGIAGSVGETTNTGLLAMSPAGNTTFHTSVRPHISCRITSMGETFFSLQLPQ